MLPFHSGGGSRIRGTCYLVVVVVGCCCGNDLNDAADRGVSITNQGILLYSN